MKYSINAMLTTPSRRMSFQNFCLFMLTFLLLGVRVPFLLQIYAPRFIPEIGLVIVWKREEEKNWFHKSSSKG